MSHPFRFFLMFLLSFLLLSLTPTHAQDHTNAQATKTFQVASVSPENGTEGVAAENARIVVAFDHPVVPLVATVDQGDLPTPITIVPAIRGTGEWVNTAIYAFTASETLAGGTTYTVTVADNLTTVDGATLAEPYLWSFRTLAPQAINIFPTQTVKAEYSTHALLTTSVAIEFSQPMEHASTEAAFRLETSNGKMLVAGHFTWNADDTLLYFQPTDILQNNTYYYVSVGIEARSASGEAVLAESEFSSFSTVGLPALRTSEPQNGGSLRPGRQRATLRFNTLMNTATYESHYLISPQPEGDITPYVNDDGSLSLEFEHQLDTMYTITLLPGIEDVYGNPLQPATLTYFVREDDVETRVSVRVPADFVIIGSYQTYMGVGLSLTGSPTVTIDVYRATLDDLMNVGFMEHSRYAQSFYDRLTQQQQDSSPAIPWVQPEKKLFSHTQKFKAGGDPVTEYLPLAENGQLNPGIYGVELTTWDKTGFALIVANTSITVKRALTGSLVWVTDMVTAQPVTHAPVKVYRDGKVFASGRTDAEGIFPLPATELSPQTELFIVVEGKGLFGVWHNSTHRVPESTRGYLYTDRPIYRPGEPVYFRGIVRNKRDMIYSVPAVETLHIRAGEFDYYSDDTVFYESDTPVSDFGTFSGSFTIPDSVAPGEYSIITGFDAGEPNYFCFIEGTGSCWHDDSSLSITFEVAEFRVPEYEVKITPERDEMMQGEPIRAVVSAQYYSGGPISGAEVDWRLWSNRAWFNYRGEKGYVFGGDSHFSAEQNVPLVTNDQGEALIQIEGHNRGSTGLTRVTIEATVVDASGQAISTQNNSILIHPSDVYVGLRTGEAYAVAEQPYPIDIITVSPESIPQPSQTVRLEVVEHIWERKSTSFGKYDYDYRTELIDSQTSTTNEDGKSVFQFRPPRAGYYTIEVQVTDQQNRSSRSEVSMWVRKPDGRPQLETASRTTRGHSWNWDDYSGQPRIYPQLEKESYRPGDTAEILIPNPFEGPATALITIERAFIMSHEVVQMNGEWLEYQLPITDQYAPTVYLSVVLIRGIDENFADPVFAIGDVALSIEPTAQRLKVILIPSVNTAAPGDTVTFDVLITDADNRPVQAEVGLALTDAAALALRSSNSMSLEATFYNFQQLYVTTSVSLRSLITAPSPPGFPDYGGGGEGSLPGLIRDDFIYTPLWSPHTVTDENGQATVSVVMPDNLTRWKLDARAVTMDTKVGQAETSVTSTLPLIVRPVTPRFFVAGDRLPMAAVVNNNTDTEQIVEVRLEAAGLTVENTPLTQTVTLPPRDRARVEWPVVVEAVDGVDLTVFAASADYQDAAKPALRTGPNATIPVYHYIAPETVSTAGMLTEATSVTEAISLPEQLSFVDGSLTVQLDPSLVAATIGGLDYLQNYPYQCVEQTVSRFLPNVITYRALNDLGVENAALKTKLTEAFDFALAKLLKEQNTDGGWGWFGGTDSHPLTSAYALLGLVEAQQAGYTVDAAMIKPAADYLNSSLIDIELNTPTWQLNRQAFLLYVLANANPADQTLLDHAASLYDSRLELSFAGSAFLLLTFQELAPNADTIAALAADLQAGAILSATGAHWEEADRDGWNWGSDTRTTALALAALIRYEPQNPLLPNVVRWLMVNRHGNHWSSTQDTAWSLMALTEWMVTTGELRGNYVYDVLLNDTSVASETVTPETVQQSQILQQPVNHLLADKINRLVIRRGDGAGALYYSAALNLELPAAEVQPASEGIALNREYFLNDDPTRTIAQAQTGEIVTVRLTLTLPQNIHYFILEDVLPAGTEIIDTQLLTETQTVEGPTLKRDDPHWYWGYWYFDKVELRDAGAILYADYLPRGVYVFTYQARAVTPGEFQVIPAQAYAFYQPEVFGRSAGGHFSVLSASH